MHGSSVPFALALLGIRNSSFVETPFFVSLVYCLWHFYIQSGISDISKARFYKKKKKKLPYLSLS